MLKFRNLFSTPHIVAMITGLLLFSLAPQQPVHERFSMLDRVAPAVVLLLITLYVMKQEIKRWIIPIPVLLLLITMAISIAQMPVIFAVKDWIAFALLTVFAIIAVSAVGPASVIQGAVISCGLIIATTCFYVIFIPAWAFEGYGPLRGAFYGSNSLALSLVMMSPALCAFTMKSDRMTFFVRVLMLTSVFTIIFFSTSRTSLIVFFVMLMAWVLFLLIKKNWKVGIGALLAAVTSGILIAFNWNAVTSTLGKSPTLSGRFPLWQAYLDAISMKPLLGYGWHIRTTPDMPLGDFINRTTGYPQINANNDLLNWWALTGLFGALLALVAVFLLIANGIRLRNISITASWIFLTGSVLLFAGQTELSTMHPDGWFILSLALVSSVNPKVNKQTLTSFGLFAVIQPKKDTLK